MYRCIESETHTNTHKKAQSNSMWNSSSEYTLYGRRRACCNSRKATAATTRRATVDNGWWRRRYAVVRCDDGGDVIFDTPLTIKLNECTHHRAEIIALYYKRIWTMREHVCVWFVLKNTHINTYMCSIYRNIYIKHMYKNILRWLHAHTCSRLYSIEYVYKMQYA